MYVSMYISLYRYPLPHLYTGKVVAIDRRFYVRVKKINKENFFVCGARIRDFFSLKFTNFLLTWKQTFHIDLVNLFTQSDFDIVLILLVFRVFL